MPRTTIGRTAVGLLLGFAIAVGAFVALVEGGQRGGDTLISNPWLAIAGLTAAATSVAGGALAIWAIVRMSERGALVFVAAAVGSLMALWVLLELAFPH